MRIRSIEVRELGPWRELKLSVDPSFQVFYGPNEVGKSTLMRFIRETLFPPNENSGEHGPIMDQPGAGALEVETSDGPRRIERSPGEHSVGRPTKAAPRKGADAAAGIFSHAAGGIDGDIYARVFAIGLREVQELATLGNRESARQLYELSCGVDGRQLASLQSQLAQARRAYWNSEGNGHEVGRLLKEVRRWKRQFASAQAAAGTAAESARRHQECLAELDRLRTVRRSIHAALVALESSKTIQEKVARRDMIDARLAAFGAQPDLPEDIAARGEASTNRVRAARQAWRRWKRRHAKARTAWKRQRDNSLAPLSPAIVQDLERRIDHLRSREAELERWRAEFTALSASGSSRQPRTITRSGGKDSLVPAALRISKRDAQRLRGLGRSMIEARRAFHEGQSELERLQNDDSRSSDSGPERTATESPPLERDFTEKQTRELGERVTSLRKLVQAEDRRDELERHRAQLEERLARVREADLQPIWNVAGLGLLFVAGVGASLLGVGKLVLPMLFFGAAYAWPLAIGGIVAASISVLWKWYGDQRVDAELETIEQRTAVFENQMAQAERELERLREEIADDADDPHELLAMAEKELADLESRQTRWNASAKTPPSAAPQRLAELEADFHRARRRWRKALRRFQLPDSFRPRDLGSLLAGIRDERRTTEHAVQIRQAMDQAEQELNGIKERLARALDEAQLKIEYSDPDGLLAALREEADRRDAAERNQRAVKDRAARARRRYKMARRRLQAARRQRRRLFMLAGAWDEAHFQRILERRAEVETLRRERDALTSEVEASLVAFAPGVGLREALAKVSSANSREERERLGEKLRAIDAAIREKSAESERQRLELAASGDLWEHARIRLRGDLAARRLRKAKNEWRSRALLETALRGTARRFEAEHQPPILRQASPYFERLTRGRYTHVLARFGERALYVQDSNGPQYAVESLSDGTREQLYLCLRLALMASFAEKGTRLPIVLDDVFVNYDDGRARAAAELIWSCARESNLQIIVFTCHRHLSRIFAELGAQVDTLPSQSEDVSEVFESSTTRHAPLDPPDTYETTASSRPSGQEFVEAPASEPPDIIEEMTDVIANSDSGAEVESVLADAVLDNGQVFEDRSEPLHLDSLPLAPWTHGDAPIVEGLGPLAGESETGRRDGPRVDPPFLVPSEPDSPSDEFQDQEFSGTSWEELSQWEPEFDPAEIST